MALSRKPVEIVDEGTHALLAKADRWERVDLIEIADVQNGCAFSSEFFNHNCGLPLIRIRDVNKTITENLYSGPYDEEFVVHKGDLLVGMDGDFRRAFWKGDNALLNQRVCRIIPKTELYEYSFLYIVLQPYLNAINEETSSVTVKHLSSRTVSDIPLPLPPLNEQKRIVAKIEELFSELEAGEESFRQARRQLGVYRQSLLKQAFEGKLTAAWRELNSDLLESHDQFLRLLSERAQQAQTSANDVHDIPSWSYKTLDELTEFITSGSRGWAKYYSDSGSLFIRAQNINRDCLNLDNIAFVAPPESAEGKRTRVRYGDLLVTITGANPSSRTGGEKRLFLGRRDP